MKIGFASTAMGLTRDRIAFWLDEGCSLVRLDGAWRLQLPAGGLGPRKPSPAPISDAIARQFIARGARTGLAASDLFARAA